MRFSPLLLMAALASPVGAQERGAFIGRLGRDTVAIDRFARHADRLEGELVLRSPRVSRTTYRLAFDAEGVPVRLDMEPLQADGSPQSPRRMTTVEMGRDTLVLTARVGDSVVVQRWPIARGVVPLLSPFYSYALIGEALRRPVPRAAPGDSVPLRVYLLGSRNGFDTWQWRDGDAVRMRWAQRSIMRARVDAQGRLLEVNSLESTIRAIGTRVSWEAVEGVSARWVADERAGRAFGSLSPRDTVRGTVGSAQILVDYSRPATRGRSIFGETVSFGQVWRAGADAATQLDLSADVMIGGYRVRAGRYSLWMVPRDSTQAILIINSQSGQWGTQYRAERDIFHLPLAVTHSAPPAERFTIALETAGTGATLTLAWDRSRYAIPVTAVP